MGPLFRIFAFLVFVSCACGWVTVSPTTDGDIAVNIQGTTHIGSYHHTTNETRDLHVSGDVYVGGTIPDATSTLTVVGKLEVIDVAGLDGSLEVGEIWAPEGSLLFGSMGTTSGVDPFISVAAFVEGPDGSNDGAIVSGWSGPEVFISAGDEGRVFVSSPILFGNLSDPESALELNGDESTFRMTDLLLNGLTRTLSAAGGALHMIHDSDFGVIVSGDDVSRFSIATANGTVGYTLETKASGELKLCSGVTANGEENDCQDILTAGSQDGLRVAVDMTVPGTSFLGDLSIAGTTVSSHEDLTLVASGDLDLRANGSLIVDQLQFDASTITATNSAAGLQLLGSGIHLISGGSLSASVESDASLTAGASVNLSSNTSFSLSSSLLGLTAAEQVSIETGGTLAVSAATHLDMTSPNISVSATDSFTMNCDSSFMLGTPAAELHLGSLTAAVTEDAVLEVQGVTSLSLAEMSVSAALLGVNVVGDTMFSLGGSLDFDVPNGSISLRTSLMNINSEGALGFHAGNAFTVSAESISLGSTLLDLDFQAASNVNVEAQEDLLLSAQGGIVISSNATYHVQSPTVMVNGSNTLDLFASRSASLTSGGLLSQLGANITLEAESDVQVVAGQHLHLSSGEAYLTLQADVAGVGTGSGSGSGEEGTSDMTSGLTIAADTFFVSVDETAVLSSPSLEITSDSATVTTSSLEVTSSDVSVLAATTVVSASETFDVMVGAGVVSAHADATGALSVNAHTAEISLVASATLDAPTGFAVSTEGTLAVSGSRQEFSATAFEVIATDVALTGSAASVLMNSDGFNVDASYAELSVENNLTTAVGGNATIEVGDRVRVYVGDAIDVAAVDDLNIACEDATLTTVGDTVLISDKFTVSSGDVSVGVAGNVAISTTQMDIGCSANATVEIADTLTMAVGETQVVLVHGDGGSAGSATLVTGSLYSSSETLDINVDGETHVSTGSYMWEVDTMVYWCTGAYNCTDNAGTVVSTSEEGISISALSGSVNVTAASAVRVSAEESFHLQTDTATASARLASLDIGNVDVAVADTATITSAWLHVSSDDSVQFRSEASSSLYSNGRTVVEAASNLVLQSGETLDLASSTVRARVATLDIAAVEVDAAFDYLTLSTASDSTVDVGGTLALAAADVDIISSDDVSLLCEGEAELFGSLGVEIASEGVINVLSKNVFVTASDAVKVSAESAEFTFADAASLRTGKDLTLLSTRASVRGARSLGLETGGDLKLTGASATVRVQDELRITAGDSLTAVGASEVTLASQGTSTIWGEEVDVLSGRRASVVAGEASIEVHGGGRFYQDDSHMSKEDHQVTITMRSAGNVTTFAEEGIRTVSGANLELMAGTTAHVEAGDEVHVLGGMAASLSTLGVELLLDGGDEPSASLQCAGDVSMDAGGDVVIRGTGVTVVGSDASVSISDELAVQAGSLAGTVNGAVSLRAVSMTVDATDTLQMLAQDTLSVYADKYDLRVSDSLSMDVTNNGTISIERLTAIVRDDLLLTVGDDMTIVSNDFFVDVEDLLELSSSQVRANMVTLDVDVVNATLAADRVSASIGQATFLVGSVDATVTDDLTVDVADDLTASVGSAASVTVGSLALSVLGETDTTSVRFDVSGLTDLDSTSASFTTVDAMDVTSTAGDVTIVSGAATVLNVGTAFQTSSNSYLATVLTTAEWSVGLDLRVSAAGQDDYIYLGADGGDPGIEIATAGDLSVAVEGNTTAQLLGDIAATVGGSIEVSCAGDISVIASDVIASVEDIAVTASSATMGVTTNAVLDVGDAIVVTGTSLDVSATDGLELNAQDVLVDGSERVRLNSTAIGIDASEILTVSAPMFRLFGATTELYASSDASVTAVGDLYLSSEDDISVSALDTLTLAGANSASLVSDSLSLAATTALAASAPEVTLSTDNMEVLVNDDLAVRVGGGVSLEAAGGLDFTLDSISGTVDSDALLTVTDGLSVVAGSAALSVGDDINVVAGADATLSLGGNLLVGTEGDVAVSAAGSFAVEASSGSLYTSNALDVLSGSMTIRSGSTMNVASAGALSGSFASMAIDTAVDLILSAEVGSLEILSGTGSGSGDDPVGSNGEVRLRTSGDMELFASGTTSLSSGNFTASIAEDFAATADSVTITGAESVQLSASGSTFGLYDVAAISNTTGAELITVGRAVVDAAGGVSVRSDDLDVLLGGDSEIEAAGTFSLVSENFALSVKESLDATLDVFTVEAADTFEVFAGSSVVLTTKNFNLRTYEEQFYTATDNIVQSTGGYLELTARESFSLLGDDVEVMSQDTLLLEADTSVSLVSPAFNVSVEEIDVYVQDSYFASVGSLGLESGTTASLFAGSTMSLLAASDTTVASSASASVYAPAVELLSGEDGTTLESLGSVVIKGDAQVDVRSVNDVDIFAADDLSAVATDVTFRATSSVALEAKAGSVTVYSAAADVDIAAAGDVLLTADGLAAHFSSEAALGAGGAGMSFSAGTDSSTDSTARLQATGAMSLYTGADLEIVAASDVAVYAADSFETDSNTVTLKAASTANLGTPGSGLYMDTSDGGSASLRAVSELALASGSTLLLESSSLEAIADTAVLEVTGDVTLAGENFESYGATTWKAFGVDASVLASNDVLLSARASATLNGDDGVSITSASGDVTISSCAGAGSFVVGDSDLVVDLNSGDTTIAGPLDVTAGPVSIGARASGDYELDVTGGIRAVSVLETSDARLKHVVGALNPQTSLDSVRRLRGVSFTWKDAAAVGEVPARLHLGLLAQEVEEVLPEVVNTGTDGTKAVAYTELVAVLVEAVEAVDAENSQLRTQVDELNERLGEAENKYEALEDVVTALLHRIEALEAAGAKV